MPSGRPASQASTGRTSMPRQSRDVSRMPSLSAKPSAKASRSCGVAIITACETPLKTSATGTSVASRSSRASPAAGAPASPNTCTLRCASGASGLGVVHDAGIDQGVHAGPASCGSNTTGIDLEVGVPASRATESSGTSGLVSG